jgi:streptomycin 3"-adenylyltransferase
MSTIHTRQVEGAVRVARNLLGADLAGAYLYGSAVEGGLHPHSDVDVLVVSWRRTTMQERRALVEGLLGISGVYPQSGRARPIELTLVVHADVFPWRYPPRHDFQYGEWLRNELERGSTPSPTTDPDLAVLITMARQSSIALFGPPAHEVFDPVPWNDLVRALVAGVPRLLDELESDTRNVVLTLARIWVTLATGTICSKDVAADWALSRLPTEHRPVLDRARSIYLGDREEHWADLLPRVHPYADRVTNTIGRLARYLGREHAVHRF